MTAGAEPSPEPVVICGQCGEPYQMAGRGNGGWFHFMVVAVRSRPDGLIRISGHWRAGDWIDGAPLEVRTSDGRRVAIIGGEMEQPLNSACETRGQRTLIVPEFSPLDASGCIHAAR